MLPKGIKGKRNSRRNKREERKNSQIEKSENKTDNLDQNQERNVLKVMEPASRALRNQKEAEVEAVPGLRDGTEDVLPSSVIIWMLVPLLLS